MTVRDLGLVSQVFDEEKLRALQRRDGDRPRALLDHRLVGVGERPAGLPLGPPPGRARPQRQPDQRGRAARRAAPSRASQFRSHLGLGDHRRAALHPPGRRASRTRWPRSMPRLEGAFSTVVMTKDARGRLPRPAPACGRCALGQLGDRYCVASESCAFDIIGAELLREVQPGEMVSLGERGIETRQVVESDAQGLLRLRAHLLRPARLDPRGQPHRRSRGARWARSSGARRRSRPTW